MEMLLKLKLQLKRRLDEAAEEIFELLEKTLAEYEEETQRQRTLLGQLLQPRVQLLRTETELQSKAVQHPLPRVKEERDVILIQPCSGQDTAPPAAGGAVHTCSFCGKGYRWRHMLQRHLQVHTGEKRFRCPVCAKAFTRKDTVRIHMTVHSDSRPFSCSVCGTTMKTGRALKRHVSRLHRDLDHQDHRDLDQDHRDQDHLDHRDQDHLDQDHRDQDHLDHRDHRDQDHLDHRDQDHRRNQRRNPRRNPSKRPQELLTTDRIEPPPGGALSSGPPPGGALSRRRVRSLRRFCLICSSGFRYDSELLQHMRVHSGERPFSCSVCTRTFARRSNLRSHMTLHSGHKPFSCCVCDKAFTTRQHLRRHAALHRTHRDARAGGGAEAGDGAEGGAGLIYCSI